MTVAAQSANAYRIARQASRLTLAEAAEAIGVSVPYLSDIERGRRGTLTIQRAIVADCLYESGSQLLALSLRERMPFLSCKQIMLICQVIKL